MLSRISYITPQCAFGKPSVSLIHGLTLHALTHIAPQCPFGKPPVSLIHGLRPIKTAIDKSVCKQPVCPRLFSHCSLLTWTLYQLLPGLTNLFVSSIVNLVKTFDSCSQGSSNVQFKSKGKNPPELFHFGD